jgi:DNA-directed RNA polymerase specialized sigma24 family protein
MDELERLDERALGLLLRLASNPEDPCGREFDALLYEFVWRYLRAKGEDIATRVAVYTGSSGPAAPALQPGELAEVAHDATILALRRVRDNAARFDPGRGKTTLWVIGAAEYAYVEVAKAIAHARRSPSLVFEDPNDLPHIPDSSPSTEEHVVGKVANEQALSEAVSVLSEREFAALRLVDTLELTYAEAAERMFGDAGMDRVVEGLLTRGRRRLAAAWEGRQPSVSGGSSKSRGAGKVPGRSADNVGEEHV